MADNQNIRTALEGLGSFTQPQEPEAIPQEAPAPMMQEIPQGGPQGGPTPQPPAPTPAPALSPVQEAVIKTTEAEAAKPPEFSPLQNILMATGLVEDQRPVEPVKDQGPYVPPPQTIEELTGRPEPLQSGIAGEVSSAVLGGVESAGRQAVNAFSFFFPGIAEKLIDQRDPDTGQPMRTLSTDPKDFVASPNTTAGRFVADLIGQGIAAFGVGKVGTLATQVKGLGTAGKIIRGAGAALSTEKAVGWEAKALAYMTSNGVENLFQDMVDTRPDAVMTLESLMGLADKDRVIRSIRDVNNVDDLQTYVMRKMDVFATGAVVGTAVGVTFEKILGGLSKIVTGSLLKRAPEVMEKFPDDFRDSSGKLIPVADGVTQRGDDLISEGLDDLVDSRVKMTQPPEPVAKAGGAGEEPPVGGRGAAPEEPEGWDNWGEDRARRTVDAVLQNLGRGEDPADPTSGLIERYNRKLSELRDKAQKMVETKPGDRAATLPHEVIHFETADVISDLSRRFDELMDNIDTVQLPTVRTPDRRDVPITADDFKKAVVLLYRDLVKQYAENSRDPMQLVMNLSRVKMPKFFADSPNELTSGASGVMALHDIFSDALNKFNKRDIAEVDRALIRYNDAVAARPQFGIGPEQQLAEAITGAVPAPEKSVASNLMVMTLAKDTLSKVTTELNGVNVLDLPDDEIGNVYANLINAAKTIKALKQQGAIPFEEGRTPQASRGLVKETLGAQAQFDIYETNTPEILNNRLADLVETAGHVQRARRTAAEMADFENQLRRIRGEPGTVIPDDAVGAVAARVLVPYQRRLGDVIIRLARAGVLNNADLKALRLSIAEWQDRLADSRYGFLLHEIYNEEQRKTIQTIQAINDIFLSKAEETGKIPSAADIPSLVEQRAGTTFAMSSTYGMEFRPHMSAIEAELENMLKMHEGGIKTPTFAPGGREGGMFKGEAKPVGEIVEQQNIGAHTFQVRRLMDRFGFGSLKARVLMSQLTVLYSNTITAIIDQLGAAAYGVTAKIFKGRNMDNEARLALWRAKQTAGLGAALDLAKLRFSKMANDSETGRKLGAMGDAFRSGRPTVTRPQTVIEEAISRTQTARGVVEVNPEAATKVPRMERFLGGETAAESFIPGFIPGAVGKVLSIPEKIAGFGPKSMAFIDEFFKQRALEIEYKAAAISAFLRKHGSTKTFEQAEAFAEKEWADIYNRSVLQTEAEIYKRAARNVDNTGRFNKATDPILYSMAVEIEYRRVLTDLNQNVDDVPEWLSMTTNQVREYMNYQASTLDYKNNQAGALLSLARGGGGVTGAVAKTLIMFPQTAVNELIRTGDLLFSIPTLIRDHVGNIKPLQSVAEWEKATATTISPSIKELMHPDIAVRSRARGRLAIGALLTGYGLGSGIIGEWFRGDTVSESTGAKITTPEGAKMPGVEYPTVAQGPSKPSSERITEATRRLNLKPATVGTFEVPVISPLVAAAQESGAAVVNFVVGLGELRRLVGLAQKEMTAPNKPGGGSELGERIALIADYIGSDDFIDPIKNAIKNPGNVPAEIMRGMFSPALGGTPLLGLIIEMAGDYKYDNRAELDYFEGPEDENPVQRMIKIAADKGRVKRTKEGLKVQSPMLRDFMRSILKYRGRDLLDAFGDGTDTQDPEANRAVFDGLVASGWAIESIPRLMSDPSYKSPNIGQIDLKKFKMADGRSAYEHIADFVAYGSKEPVGAQVTNVAERNNPAGWIGGKFNKTLIQVMQDEFFAKLPPDWKASDFDLSLTARKDDAKYTRTKQQMDRLNLLLRSRYEVALRLIIDQSEVEKAEAAQKGITRKSLKTDFANIPGATR